MTLGIFLTMGDSFKNMASAGQDELFKNFYLSYFAKNFDKVYIFSYDNEKGTNLPANVSLIPNKHGLHRYIYAILMPFLNIKTVLMCDVFRVYHLLGTPPAIISRIFFSKPYIFNYAYDYQKFTQIEKKSFQLYLVKMLELIAIFFSEKIFAANKIILKKLSPNKAAYLPNGVDAKFFKPTKIKRKSNIPIILSVGRLEKQKNFTLLINAMKGIKAKLIIVGRGSLKVVLERLAHKNNVNLEIIEKVPHNKMPEIYHSADIFISPSLAEGSPKVLLEAMACGLLVIGTNVEGTREIIKNDKTGLICNIDWESLHTCIKKILNDKTKRERIRRNSTFFVRQNYDLEKLLKREVQLLRGFRG